MKHWLLSVAAAGVLVSQPTTAEESFPKLKDQLEIFTEILETAAKQEDKLPLTSVRYSYLRDQGVVLRAHLGASRWSFVVPQVEEPPMPPEAPEMGKFARDLQLDEVVEQGLRSAHRILSKLSGEYSDEWFELTEAQRDLEWEMRDVRRQIDDMEFALRNADDAKAEEIRQSIQEQQQELTQLRNKKDELRQESEKLKKELVEKREKIEQERLQTRDQLVKRAETLITQTLCDYGVTLKALDDDEFISVVLEGADNSRGEVRQERVYMFSVDDVRQCSSSEDAAQLLNTAAPYYF